MTAEVTNFVVNLDLLLQEGFKVSRVHDSIFNWVSAVDCELEVELLLLHTLALESLSLSNHLNSFLLLLDSSLQSGSFLCSWGLSSGSSFLFNCRLLGSWSSGCRSGRLFLSSLSRGSLGGRSLRRGSLCWSSFGRSSLGGSRSSLSWSSLSWGSLSGSSFGSFSFGRGGSLSCWFLSSSSRCLGGSLLWLSSRCRCFLSGRHLVRRCHGRKSPC